MTLPPRAKMEKGKLLSRAFTTGLLAAAAAKGAASAWAGEREDAVSLYLPSGEKTTVSLSFSRSGVGWGEAAVVQRAKEAGPLRGAEIVARVTSFEGDRGAPDIFIEGGAGIGVVTRPGFSVPIGAKAIDPGSMKMIRAAAAEAIAEIPNRNGVFRISISVPNGEEIGRRTLNSRFGVMGGISILGGKGILTSHAEGHRETIRWALRRAKRLGLKEAVLQPGGAGPSLSDETILVGKHQLFASRMVRAVGLRVRKG